ncbi:MAG: decaprenyl-phosphate phosphoribosyltransferase [Planctomycetota bacterium]
MRPHQWVKNVFVLAALVFALGETGADLAAQSDRIVRVLLATASFCLGASAIYLLNDVMDVESDRLHPTKRDRPIAAGLVSVPLALATSVVCVVGALLLAHRATPDGGRDVAWVVLAYMTQNLGYSMGLKRVAILDAFLIAFGFLLRVLAGGLAAGAPVSRWLMLCTFFLALFLAFCKRRAEIDLLGSGAGEHRKNLRDYTTGFLDQAAGVLAASTIITYAMYAVDNATIARYSGGQYLVWTVPFVVFGLFRYLLLVQRSEGGGNPTRMLLGGDAIFVTNAVLYGVALVFVLFHGRL